MEVSYTSKSKPDGDLHVVFSIDNDFTCQFTISKQELTGLDPSEYQVLIEQKIQEITPKYIRPDFELSGSFSLNG